jgi:hypothetical protein
MSADSIEWELVNPEGAARAVSLRPAVRPSRLDGMTIGLAWNGKPGGDDALDEIAARLDRQFEGIRFIRYWQTLPESVAPRELSRETIQAIANTAPDLVIVAQAD